MFENSLEDSGTFYDVLDIPPSATPGDVREAYLRAKSAYNKDSVALYSLIDASERELTLRRIEEAYEVLSNEQRRRDYDAHHGIIENTGIITSFDSPDESKPVAKVVSIDRIPPMESMGSDEDPLVAPSTDIPLDAAIRSPAPPSISKAPPIITQDPPPRAFSVAADLEREIAGEVEWRGSFLRRVREVQGLSLEEVSNITKIRKTYLSAIENEEFKKLPALVFVRGFLMQACRVLRLPQDKVLDAYLRRLKAAKTDE